MGLGRSAASEVSGVDTSIDDIVAVRGARFPVGVTFDRSYDQIEAQRGASSLTVAGTDVSYPAFWLPFQDLDTNNHLGQWAQKSLRHTGKVMTNEQHT
jgi:hypothetical protein